MGLIKSALLSANRAHILGAMLNFRHLAGSNWLATGHPAAQGQFPSQAWAVVSGLPAAQLIQAVAVAAPNHCVDGWSYAARATSALLAGDYHACRHLSYYAQLRAGLSILANLGVGLFNRVNFVVTATGGIVRLDTAGPAPKLLGLGTHMAVWEGLKAWSADSAAARQLLDLIRIRGVSLRDMLEAVWPGSSSSAVAASLMRSWGLDLARGKDEHDYRNISSYNAQSLNPLHSPIAVSLDVVGQFWELCEPNGGGGFQGLDRYLIRSVLWQQHRSVTGNENYQTSAISRNYNSLPAAIRSYVSKDFLTGQSEPDDPQLMAVARAQNTPAEPVEMLARSYLLLRAATALTHTSFVDAGLDLAGGDLRPWVDELAERRGFWAPGAPLPDPSDLWADIELAMMDYDAARDQGPSSWHEWMKTSDRGLPHVSEMERVGVWSLSA